MIDFLNQLSVNPKKGITLAHQLKQQITWLIASGKLKPGDQLPTLRHLAQHLSINLHTVHSAYKMLETEGLVEARRGRGTHILSYDLRRMAQAATLVRTHSVGLIVANLANPFYHSLLQGVAEEADLAQILVFVCSTQDDPVKAWRYFIQLSAQQVDGVIVVSHHVGDLMSEVGSPIRGNFKTLPFVTVDWPGTKGPAVLLDLEGAGYQATQHLLQHGHRRIGLITYVSDIANVKPVNDGYYRALKEAGIPTELCSGSDPALVARVGGFDIESGVEGAGKLLSLPHPPTAIFAFTDLIAAGALQYFKGIGCRVPQDIALVGFNDIPLAGLLDPPLTTVAAPAYEMGRTAMRMLQSLIDGKALIQPQVVLPTSLVIRGSCGEHPET